MWVAFPGQSPTRSTVGVDGLAAGPIAAGQTQYIGSVRFTSPTNITHPGNPSPGGGGGGGGVGGLPLTFEQILLIAGAGVAVLIVLAIAFGGD
jgi:hypothetical protein